MNDKIIFRLIIALAIFGCAGLLCFGLAGLSDPNGFLPTSERSDGERVHYLYMAARNVAIVLTIIAVLREKRALGWILLLDGFVQSFDTVIGVVHAQVMQAMAPLVLAVLFFASGGYLLRKERATQPFSATPA